MGMMPEERGPSARRSRGPANPQSPDKDNTSPRDRYFYHCFPRPRAGADQMGKGLRILESMVKSELLLTPETTKWQESVLGGCRQTMGGRVRAAW